MKEKHHMGIIKLFTANRFLLYDRKEKHDMGIIKLFTANRFLLYDRII